MLPQNRDRVMTRLFALLFAAAVMLLPATADHRPEIYPDGTVVYGDWGLYRPGHVVPYAERWGDFYYYRRAPYGYYFPSNKGDPFAYRSRATYTPSIPGPRYRRTWGTEPNLPADLNQVPMPQGPYVIQAPMPDNK